MVIPDPMVMLRAYLLTQTAITNTTSTRIYNEELPAADVPSMPRAAIVLNAAGGPGSEWIRTIDSRIDVRAYGATPLAARTLAWAVYDVLAWATPREMGTGRTYRVEPEIAPLSFRDPDTNWPSAVISLLVTTSREPAA